MYNLSMVSILRWNLTMLLSTLFLFSCSKSDNNEETNRKEGDKTNISVYLQQNGFLILNLVPNQISFHAMYLFAKVFFQVKRYLSN